MKKLLIILLVILPWLSKAQSLFGFSPSEIREKRPGVEWTYNKWGDNKELLTMSFRADQLHVTYFFDASNKSVFTIVIPLTKGSLQAMIEVYNKRYIIIDNYNWKYYDTGSIYHCLLKQDETDGSYFFIWYIE